MIPVYQTMTIANDDVGNCYNACVASILELPLREVCPVLPNFEGNYWGEWHRWLAERGLELNCHLTKDGVPKGFAIATGYGGRTFPEGHKKAGEPILHAAVVFNGELVHDPFPCAKEFGGIRYYWTLDPLQVEQAAA
jgi:hypothetical protein